MIASVSNEVTCRKCGARNRLKARGAPGGARPVCGRCGAPLGEEQPSVLNYEAAAAAPKDRRAENRRAIILIVMAAAALTGMAQLLLMILR
jgi:ribosomal protein L40E